MLNHFHNSYRVGTTKLSSETQVQIRKEMCFEVSGFCVKALTRHMVGPPFVTTWLALCSWPHVWPSVRDHMVGPLFVNTCLALCSWPHGWPSVPDHMVGDNATNVWHCNNVVLSRCRQSCRERPAPWPQSQPLSMVSPPPPPPAYNQQIFDLVALSVKFVAGAQLFSLLHPIHSSW